MLDVKIPVSVDVTGDVGRNSSLQIVNGFQAISYLSGTSLKYVRATNANGTAWGAPVTVESISGLFSPTSTSLEIVNGFPAISYNSGDGGLKYARATDANGTAWTVPVTVDGAGYYVVSESKRHEAGST